MLVWLVGMLPALWVVRGQWVGRRSAGARGFAWALAWPVWVVFWAAEEAFGDDGRDGEARRRR